MDTGKRRLLHSRRPNRLAGHDYSVPGAYLITLCTWQRQPLFGRIAGDCLETNAAGRMVEAMWLGLPNRFAFVTVDEFVIMPDHIHGIVVLGERGRGEPCVRPWGDGNRPAWEVDSPPGTRPRTLGRVIQAYKSLTTNAYAFGVHDGGWPAYQGKLWQRSYHDHLIRGEEDLRLAREYIADNPAVWSFEKSGRTWNSGDTVLI